MRLRLRRVRHLCRRGRWSRRRQRGLRRLLCVLLVLVLLERVLGMGLGLGMGLRLVVLLAVAAVGRGSEQAGREHRRERPSLKKQIN
jgi:hypothetical protein